MSSKWPANHIGIRSDFSIQVASLGPTELLQVEHAIAEFAPDWLVELHRPCPDEAILVLVPASGDDSVGPSFVVSQEAFGFRVDQIHWDTMTEIGAFPSLNDVLFHLRRRLAVCAGGCVPTSMMVH